MSDRLDMSLDDIIKSNRNRGRGNGDDREFGGFGPSRRFANREGTRTTPYSRPVQQQDQDAMWQNDVESGTMLHISNLDYGVSDQDIKEIFSDVGELKRYGIHYDRSGRSKGIAEVVFARRGDALEGVRRYNNVELDRKPMKIEIVGTNLSAPVPPSLASAHVQFPANEILGNFNENYIGNFNENYDGSFNGNFNGNFRGSGRGGFMGRPRGGFGSGNFRDGRGSRWGGGHGRDENISTVDLDAELDKYHKEARETKSD